MIFRKTLLANAWAKVCVLLFVISALSLFVYLIVNRLSISPTPVYITSWEVRGPFKNEVDERSDRSQKLFYHHSELSPLDFNLATASSAKDSEPGSVFTASSSIISSFTGEAYLSCGGDDAITVWVNGQKVVDRQGPGKFYSQQYCVRIRVRRGKNAISVRVRSIHEASQRIRLSVGSDWSKCVTNFLDDSGMLAEHDIVPLGGGLSYSWPVPPADSMLRIRLLQSGTAIEAAGDGRIGPELKEGPFKISVTIDSKTFTQNCYYGDAIQAARRIASGAPPDANDGHQPELSAPLRRLRVLLEPQNVAMLDPDWCAKLIFTINEYARLQKDDHVHRENDVGLHIHGFRSEVDGNVQYYRIFMPSAAARAGESIPIAVVVPTPTSAKRPFLESVFMARHIEAERWAARAERYGIAILWMGYRAIDPYGNEPEFKHLDEVLNDACLRYPVDRRRVALLGTCRAGMTATMIAIRYPLRFSGIALVDPILRRETVNQDDDRFGSFPLYRDWVRANEPLTHLSGIVGTPVYVVHDGAEEGHGSLEEAYELKSAAQHANVSIELQVVEPSVLHLNAWDHALRWCSRQQRASAADVEKPSWPLASGPLCRALSEPFVLVRPSLSKDDKEEALLRSIEQRFQSTWQASTFGVPEMIWDYEVTEQVINSRNLVLIGNERTNIVWSSRKAEINAKLAANLRSSSADVSLSDSAGALVGVIKDTKHKRRIILIGGQNLDVAAAIDVDFSIHGWFDVSIWKRGTDGVVWPIFVQAQCDNNADAHAGSEIRPAKDVHIAK